ncbi:MAG TPA: hypothetical protein VGA37_09045 [Gemmatimonadales bacterium]
MPSHRPSGLLVLAASLGISSVAHAQESTRWREFDLSRAMIRDSTVYEPFLVSETVPLGRALRDGTVRDETLVAVLERDNWRVALLIPQLAYHHVAHGKRNGEPWLVSF